jgi:hypothetical protein
MNLPCDNCKTIRTFSGEPPSCLVCGWTYTNSASLPKTDVPAAGPPEREPVWTGEQKVVRGFLLRIALLGVVVVAATFLAVQFITPGKHSDTPGRYRLALKYHLTVDDVLIDPKPAGCDFTDAPLGDKHCHFEENVYLERECLEPKCPVKRVYVSWRKVRD